MDVNQQYIADQLNLSRATVSRSLNNTPGIDAETRGRVLDLATRLGYRFSARSKRQSADSQLVGVIVCNPGGQFRNEPFASVGVSYLAGMSETASEQGAYLDVRYIEPNDAAKLLSRDTQPPGLRDGVWAGTILVYPFPHEVVKEMTRRITCVSIVNHYEGLHIDCVEPDQNLAILKLMRLLMDRGHRKIGFLNATLTVRCDWEYTRCGAYLQALLRVGLPYNPELVLNMTEHNRLDHVQLAHRIAELRRQGVTAWICATDRAAYEVISPLRDSGVRIPEDVSFVGFDGIETPPGLVPLVSAAPPLREIGATALRRLLTRLKHPASPARSIQLECTIVEGQSVATLTS